MFLFLSIALGVALARFGAVEPYAWLALSILFALVLALATLPRPGINDGGSASARLPILAACAIALAIFVDPKLALGPMAGLVAWMAVRRDSGSLVRFFHFLLAVGVLEALLGLFQYFVSPGWIFGYVNDAYVTSGTLINRNHFAGLLGMLIPVSLGLASIAWTRHRDAGRAYIYLLCGTVMGLAVVFSLSRMGMFALVLTLLFLGVLTGSQSLKMGMAFVIAPLCLLLATALWVGIDVVVERFDLAVGSEGPLQDARLAVFQDTLTLIAENPLGIGPGRYADTFRRYQRNHNEVTFTHAHNDYLETAAEWGIPLAALFWLGVFAVLIVSVRTFGRIRALESRGVLLASAGAIVYILLHSLTDFNLQIPSNAMLFFIFIGIALGASPGTRPVRTPSHDRWPHRLALAVPVLSLSVYLVFQNSGPLMAAWITRSKVPEAARYERALEWDPENADYHFRLAQIYHLSAIYNDSARIRDHYEAALQLNPDRSLHWMEFSKFLEQHGEAALSRDAMDHAIRTDPHNAQARWAAANLYIRLGELASADLELARTAALDTDYLNQVLDLVWRFYDDPVLIMETHVPNTREASLTALNYFVSQDSDAGTALAWERLSAFQTTARERFIYVDYLMGRKRVHEAYEVFLGGAQLSPLVFNGGFETEPVINAGFDWNYRTDGPVTVRRDTTQSAEGLASLRAEFDGNDNPDFSGIWHWLPVDAGQAYNLTFSLRTEALSTDEGVYVEIDSQRSKAVIGTTPWRTFNIPFVASSDLVRIRIRRNPTRKFDNRFSGRVWFDDFKLDEGAADVALR